MARPEPSDAAQIDRRATVLVIDDEDSVHEIVTDSLRGHRILSSYNGWQAIKTLGEHHVDVVLLDLNLPDTNGLKLLDTIRAERDDVEVIVITAHSDIPHAVTAMKKGAFDFFAKSYEAFRALPEHIERALAHRRHKRERLEAYTKLEWLREAFQLLERSTSPAVRAMVQLANQITDTPLTVLIEGESGVGKEVMAAYIHAHSSRAGGPFVAVNLATVPASLMESHLFGHAKGAFTGAERSHVGKFEYADGGTLFLDEVGELPNDVQVKLLRVLQEREVERLGASEPSPVDVRVVAATNKSLQAEVKAGRFREDLFYRLNVVRIPVPPLRNRIRDVPDLARLLARKHAGIMGRTPPTFTRDAQQVLMQNDWPGNIRELENLVMRLVAIRPGKAIVADDIPPEYCLRSLHKLADREARRGARNEEDRLYFLARDQFERYLVRYMVNRHNGDKRAAARALGVSLSTVKEKLRGMPADWSGNL